ncbi:MAG: diguanylate cyclase [Actinomycetota bacterium]|nr:diguanylate cyclase [Actinomycetota bacterium]
MQTASSMKLGAGVVRRGWLPTLHSRLLAMTVSVFACFLLASAFILWSMFGMQRTFEEAGAQVDDELVPVLDLEGDVRKAELAGWTVAFAIHGGAPVSVRGDFDTTSAAVSDVLDSFDVTDGGEFAEEAELIGSIQQKWTSVLEGYDTVFNTEFTDTLELATFLDNVGIEVDEMVDDLDAAQASARAEFDSASTTTAAGRNRAVWISALALVGGFVLIQVVTRMLCGRVVGVLTSLCEGSRRLASGEWGYRVEEAGGPVELAELGKSFNTMSDRLRQSHTELEYRSLHDHLTGLGNRNLIADRINHACATRDAQGRIDAFLVVDLDRFKNINDNRGHADGDEALVTAARRITSCVRATDTVARLGGDEFGVLLEGISGLDEAETIAQRIVDTMAAPIRLNSTDVIVTASVGIADAADSKGYADLISGADLAMYEAKQAGGATWRTFQDHLRTRLAERIALEEDLRTAIANDEIEVAYQAVYDLGTNQPIGLEALARWTHPTHGPISPSRFIPIAEDTGLVAGLSWNILKRACTQLWTWQQHYPQLDQLTVTVNIAAAHLQQADFTERVLHIIDTTGIRPANLILEITETMMLRPGSDTRHKLANLRDHGVQISIDD